MRPSSRPQPDRGCSPQIARPATARKATTKRNPRGCTLSRTSLALDPLAFAWRKTRLLPLFVRKHALEELANGALGKLLAELDLLRHLVWGEFVAAVGDEVLLRQRATLFLNHEDLHRLSPVFVWHADGNALDDLGMLVEHLFDIPRIDLEAARVDDLLLAVDDVEVAVVVHASDVARVQPAVAQRVRCLLGHLPVAPHHLWTFQDELPRLPCRHLLLARLDVHDLYISTGNRDPDAPPDRAPEVCVERRGCAFGEAVALPDRTPRTPLEGVEQPERDACSA